MVARGGERVIRSWVGGPTTRSAKLYYLRKRRQTTAGIEMIHPPPTTVKSANYAAVTNSTIVISFRRLSFLTSHPIAMMNSHIFLIIFYPLPLFYIHSM